MAEIEKARDVITDFLKKTLNANEVKMIKEMRTPDGWEAEAEVYEDSSFIKALGLHTRVQDRNIYEVKLNHELEVLSYERIDTSGH